MLMAEHFAIRKYCRDYVCPYFPVLPIGQRNVVYALRFGRVCPRAENVVDVQCIATAAVNIALDENCYRSLFNAPSRRTAHARPASIATHSTAPCVSSAAAGSAAAA